MTRGQVRRILPTLDTAEDQHEPRPDRRPGLGSDGRGTADSRQPLTGNREQQTRGAAQRTGGKAQGGLVGIMEKLKGLFKRG